MLLAAVTRQQGPETYSALLPQLVASAAEGPLQVSHMTAWRLSSVCRMRKAQPVCNWWMLRHAAGALEWMMIVIPAARHTCSFQIGPEFEAGSRTSSSISRHDNRYSCRKAQLQLYKLWSTRQAAGPPQAVPHEALACLCLLQFACSSTESCMQLQGLH
jgi:hypothetical protein